MTPDDEIWDEWDLIEEALGGDIALFEEALSREDSPMLRRGFCRGVFAHVEGLAGWMKRYTVLFNHPGVLGDGEKRTLERRDGALFGVFNAFDLFADTAGATTPLKKDSKEWEILQRAIRIRNRITHPASAKDVTIADSDLAEVRAARELILELIGTVLVESGEALLQRADGIVRRRNELIRMNHAPEPSTRVADLSSVGQKHEALAN